MPFQPGHKHGKGRPKVDPVLKEIKAVNRQLVEEKLAGFMTMDRTRLREVIEDEKTPMLDLMVASLVQTGIKKGDPAILSFLLDRTIGKVKESVDVDLTLKQVERAHAEAIDEIPRETLIELVRLKQGTAGDG